ncbi:MAG TPA: tetratricopeptide repeat protein [Polyangiaceae bacterium]|nr:tetratricopeptide repeat protein [Polyangiaceae bacterium]
MPSLRSVPVPAALAVFIALLACKKSSDELPPPPPPATAAPVSTGPCPTGKSTDPGQGEFRPAVTAFKDKDYATAQTLLDNLMTKYPNSATVRVWRGDAALFDRKVKYASAADNAIPFYEESEKLHDKGCALPESEHYYLRMGYAFAYLRKKESEGAIKHLEIAKKNWDNSAEVFYNLARAQCLGKDVDGCAENFEKALEIAKSLRRPKFLRSHNSLDDWIRRSRTQSEFPSLRRDKRYSAAIKKARDDD